MMASAEITERTTTPGFRPGWILTLAVALVGVVLALLGNWQVQRLAWKEALIAEIDAGLAAAPLNLDGAPVEALPAYRPVSLTSTMIAGSSVRRGLETQGGEVGTHLLSLFRDGAGRAWLVDRGWIAADRALDELVLEGPQRLVGISRPPVRRGWFTPANEPQNRQFYDEDLGAIGALAQAALQPMVIQLSEPLGDGDVPQPFAARPDLPNNHLGYAITWYGLLAALIGVYIAFGRARAREPVVGSGTSAIDAEPVS